MQRKADVVIVLEASVGDYKITCIIKALLTNAQERSDLFLIEMIKHYNHCTVQCTVCICARTL